MTSKVTSKVTSSGTPFSSLLAGLKGKKGVRWFPTVKGGGKAKQRKRREKEGKQRTQNEAVTSVQFGGHQNFR